MPVVLHWPRHFLRYLHHSLHVFLQKFPDLKFKYVEESDPEAFFIPHVWSVVYAGPELYWRPDTVCQFDPAQS